jgi:hypothetical protein
MGPTLRDHFEGELARARTLAASDPTGAWKALERAHILSQAYGRPHVRVHARMFVQAWRERRWREVVGQLPRIVLAAPGSWLGRAPLGNTGGSDVGIFTPMAIPDDLQKILDEERR